jgi:hypothetical protein
MFPIPKISYNPGTGAVTLPFTYPPMGKSGTNDLEVQRNDSFSVSGVKQSVYTRTDEFIPLSMDFVPLADLPAWESFVQFAISGGQFNYYPDATLSSFTTCTLEDKTWQPKRSFYGISKFTLRFRKVIPPTIGS